MAIGLLTPPPTYNVLVSTSPGTWCYRYVPPIYTSSTSVTYQPVLFTPGDIPVVSSPEVTYPSRDFREEETYQEQVKSALRDLVERFPKALPALMWAIREGKIDGTTYHESLPQMRLSDADHVEHAQHPRCIVGWVMLAAGVMYPFERYLMVKYRAELEAFVHDVCPGQTHRNNRWLAILYQVLEELQV